jgi:hypothetical protein
VMMTMASQFLQQLLHSLQSEEFWMESKMTPNYYLRLN